MVKPHDVFVTVSEVFRDQWLLAVDKPAGILVHGDGTGASNLTDLVRDSLGCEAAQPVQRLDVETTGIVLFSLDKAVQPALDALVAGHDMEKRYLAVVPAGFPDGVTRVDRAIGRDRHDARRMRVSKTGKPALTTFTPLARKGRETLLLCGLATGRRHQIRVHLASLGFPIVGDSLYGGRSSRDGLMLHAYEEAFDHPVTGNHLRITTEVPKRFSPWGDAIEGWSPTGQHDRVPRLSGSL